MAIKKLNPSRRTAKTEKPVEAAAAVPPPKTRTRHQAAPKPRAQRIVPPEPETYRSGTLLSREEKRQIILAHASQRKPQDPVQIVSMWAGVAACLMVVAVGWWWTVRPELGRNFDDIKPAVAESTEELKNASQMFKDLSLDNLMKPLDSINAKISDSQAKLKARQEAMSVMSNLVENGASGTGARDRDIFTPSAVTGTTGTVPVVPDQK